MEKFRRKPVVIEAVQYTGENNKECLKFIGNNYDNTLDYPNIKTLEGTMRVDVGDWIIRDVNGEHYPCKTDIFEKTYDPVIENFEDMIGKTIISAKQMKLKGCDDKGFLRLEFSDRTSCIIAGGYGEYTGESESEYQTLICIGSRQEELEDMEDITNASN